MLSVNFVQFLANLIIAGFLIRSVQRTWPDSTFAKALSVVY